VRHGEGGFGCTTSHAARARFQLSTHLDNLYPDFIGRLSDGRFFVAEYKGALIADTSDTNEKRTIGALSEKSTNGKGVFVVVEKLVNGKDMRTQLAERFGSPPSANREPFSSQMTRAWPLRSRKTRTPPPEDGGGENEGIGDALIVFRNARSCGAFACVSRARRMRAVRKSMIHLDGNILVRLT
jgi:hypothetical protein